MDYMTQAREAYEGARRKARRAYDAHVAQGRSGQLPYLDEVRKRYPVIAEVRMGILEVPLSRLAGTYSASRASSFAANFMPLAPASSEFGQKWTALCRVHLEEGIRHPVKLYEYLGKYYCMEGNKRVSVLKHFEAYTISAEVIRLIPQRDDTNPDVVQYYNFLDYARDGVFPALYLTRKRAYARLRAWEQTHLPDPSPEIRQYMHAQLSRFEQAFDMMALNLPAGDAFLEYLHIYGIPEDITLADLRARIERILPQIKLAVRPTAPAFSMEESEARQSLIARILPWKRRLRVGFAYKGDASERGSWADAHEYGRLEMLGALGDRVVCAVRDGLTPETAYAGMRDMLETGVDLLFVTSSQLGDAALRLALEYPKNIVMLCAPAQPRNSLVTYFGRYHEAMFLCGVAAGLSGRADRVGYITADLDMRKDTMDINAFALGMQLVNPRARVQLAFIDHYGREECDAAFRSMTACGVDVAMLPQALGTDLPRGCYSFLARLSQGKIGDFLAAPRWNWGPFYTSMVESVLSGTLASISELYPEGGPVVHFWWGLATGVLDFYTQPFLPARTAHFLGQIADWVADGTLYPFTGPIVDKRGTERAQDQESLDPVRILSMRWLADNVLLPDECEALR